MLKNKLLALVVVSSAVVAPQAFAQVDVSTALTSLADIAVAIGLILGALVTVKASYIAIPWVLRAMSPR